MTIRRLVATGILQAFVSCHQAGSSAPPQPAQPRVAVAFDRAVDLVPAAGLGWLVELRPREILADAAAAAALAILVPRERFDAFARRHGGIDLRQAEQLVIAGYANAVLVVARVPFDPDLVEAAFAARANPVQGRLTERSVRRIWGEVGGAPQELALFSGDGLALERGRADLVRAAVYFAEGRLRRSRPALRAEPLASAAELAGAAPLRVFAAGPFRGEWSGGAAGLLGASTAVAAAARVQTSGAAATLVVRVVLTGAWTDDASAAEERLRAVFDVLASDPLGRLTGIDRPVQDARVFADAGALHLDVALDLAVLARGLHAVVDASAEEILAQ